MITAGMAAVYFVYVVTNLLVTHYKKYILLWKSCTEAE